MRYPIDSSANVAMLQATSMTKARGASGHDVSITPPQSTVLSVGAFRTVPAVGSDGSLGVAHRIDLGLACDHRVLDGAKAARLLAAIVEALEEPARLLGERDG